MADDNVTQDQINESARRLAMDADSTVQSAHTVAENTLAETRRAMVENASIAKDKASDALLNAAQVLRDEAMKTNNEDLVRQAQHLAGGIEKTALYLDSRTLDQMGEDAAAVVRSNPLQAMGVVLIFGLVLGLIVGGSGRHHD